MPFTALSSPFSHNDWGSIAMRVYCVDNNTYIALYPVNIYELVALMLFYVGGGGGGGGVQPFL